jgi:hypothetical protein
MAVTLNPATLGAGLTLSNGNLTVTHSSAVYSTVVATLGRTSGKWYFEVIRGAGVIGGGTEGYIGISSVVGGVDTLNAYMACIGAANITSPGVADRIGATQPDTEVSTMPICCAVDLDNLRFYIRGKTTGYWDGSPGGDDPTNPATGCSISTLTGPFKPCAVLKGAGRASTFNFGATAFAGTVPVGYSAYDPSLISAQAIAMIMA